MLSIDPTSPEAHFLLGDLLDVTGRPAQALDHYLRALEETHLSGAGKDEAVAAARQRAVAPARGAVGVGVTIVTTLAARRVDKAALVSALEVLDRARYQKTIKRFRADLASAQGKSGSWCNNETQPSVHAVLALMYSPFASERRAARNGIGWLKSTLLRPGSLASFNDHMPEPFVGRVFSGVNAEALTALSAACAIERENRQE